MKTRAVVLTSATLTTSAPAAPKRAAAESPTHAVGGRGDVQLDDGPSPWLEADEPAPRRDPGDGFSFIRSRLGVEFDADALVVPSPFDYSRQAALYLPRRMPEPRSPEYAARAQQEIVDLVELTGGGAFVLCTSVRAMRQLSQACAFDIPHPVLVQGQAPKQALLTRFRAAGDAVLFATMSFWEGVDVSGDALRLVIVDKLPFSVPADPLIAARCESLRERGVPPFMNYLVPSAALTLKQGFGRLIRSRRDTGVVALLDGRVATKGYGRAFLNALPDAKRCTTQDEVRAAIERFESS